LVPSAATSGSYWLIVLVSRKSAAPRGTASFVTCRAKMVPSGASPEKVKAVHTTRWLLPSKATAGSARVIDDSCTGVPKSEESRIPCGSRTTPPVVTRAP
jgi:hypothetical protein